MSTARRAFLVLALVALLLLLPLTRAFVYTVDEREMVVILQFGEPVAARIEPGLYFKMPFVQEVRRLPKSHQFWSGGEAEMLVDLPTADGKKIEVTPWAVWRITDPVRFVQVLRTVENAQLRVKTLVRAAVRDVVTSSKMVDVVRSTPRKLTYALQIDPNENQRPGREKTDPTVVPPAPAPVEQVTVGRKKLIATMKERVHDRLAEAGEAEKGRGVELVDVGISRIEFVEVVREAAFERLIAFMESIASRHTNEGERRKREILNRTEAEVQRILGEGKEEASAIRGRVEAEVIEAYAKAVETSQEFFTFVRTLEAYEAVLIGQTRLVLSTDSPFWQLLRSDVAVPKKP